MAILATLYPPVTVEKLQLALDSRSFTPYYQQIVDHVRALVEKEKLKQGQNILFGG